MSSFESVWRCSPELHYNFDFIALKPVLLSLRKNGLGILEDLDNVELKVIMKCADHL